MKKMIFFIMVVVSALALAACQKNGVASTVSDSITAKETLSEGTKVYLLKDGQESFIPQITLHESDNTFQFSYDPSSSYLAIGAYTVDHGQLELKTDDGKYHYTFAIADENTLIFDQEKSSDIKALMGEKIADGAEFITDISDAHILEDPADSSIEQREPVSPEIEACIRAKLATFEEECELIDLWYDKEKSDQIIDSYMKYGKGSANGVKRENVIVIMSDLKTGKNTWSFEPNTVYTDWNWILVREDEASEWIVDDYGNE